MNPSLRLLPDILASGAGRHRRTRGRHQEPPVTYLPEPIQLYNPHAADTGDLISAVTDLCSRAGAHCVEVGYSLPADGIPGPSDWYAFTAYGGNVIAERGHPTPETACYALATRFISGVLCDCSLAVTLNPGMPGPDGSRWDEEAARRDGWCVWKLCERRWLRACDHKPITYVRQARDAPGLNGIPLSDWGPEADAIEGEEALWDANLREAHEQLRLCTAPPLV